MVKEKTFMGGLIAEVLKQVEIWFVLLITLAPH